MVSKWRAAEADYSAASHSNINWKKTRSVPHEKEEEDWPKQDQDYTPEVNERYLEDG